jgi:HSP20 family molecular chaperone IbpA
VTHREDIERLESIQELIDDLWQVPRFARGVRHGFRPPIDCYRKESPRELVVVAELAGIGPEDVRIEVGERILACCPRMSTPRVQKRPTNAGS